MALPKRKHRNPPKEKGKLQTKVVVEDTDAHNWVGRKRTKKDDDIANINTRAKIKHSKLKNPTTKRKGSGLPLNPTPTRIGSKMMDSRNTLLLRKGTIPPAKRPYGSESLVVFAWDKLISCNTNCPILGKCELRDKALSASEPKCLVMQEYLGVTMNVLMKYNDKVLDEGLSFRIGTHLIPLYRQLFRMKLVEISLDNVLVHGKMGVKVHPVFKEMREVIGKIEDFWKQEKMRGPIEPVIRTPKGGDITYYEGLEDGDATPKKVVRILKRKDSADE